jgi:hypothetical protein
MMISTCSSQQEGHSQADDTRTCRGVLRPDDKRHKTCESGMNPPAPPQVPHVEVPAACPFADVVLEECPASLAACIATWPSATSGASPSTPELTMISVPPSSRPCTSTGLRVTPDRPARAFRPAAPSVTDDEHWHEGLERTPVSSRLFDDQAETRLWPALLGIRDLHAVLPNRAGRMTRLTLISYPLSDSGKERSNDRQSPY